MMYWVIAVVLFVVALVVVDVLCELGSLPNLLSSK